MKFTNLSRTFTQLSLYTVTVAISYLGISNFRTYSAHASAVNLQANLERSNSVIDIAPENSNTAPVPIAQINPVYMQGVKPQYRVPVNYPNSPNSRYSYPNNLNNANICANYRAQMAAFQAQQRYQNQTGGELGAMTGGQWQTVDSNTGLNVPSSPPAPPPGCR
jgi:hypothetical protein